MSTEEVKALVEELRYGAEYGCDADLIERAADAIEELMAQVKDKDYLIQQQTDKIERLRRDVKKQHEKMIELAKGLPHWVSVKERLPNVGELVVGLDADGHAEITMLGESKCWLTYGLRIHNLGCYVWWMPLPEPPQEVQDADN